MKRRAVALTVVWDQALARPQQQVDLVASSLDEFDGPGVRDALRGLAVDLHDLIPDLSTHSQYTFSRFNRHGVGVFNFAFKTRQQCQIVKAGDSNTQWGHKWVFLCRGSFFFLSKRNSCNLCASDNRVLSHLNLKPCEVIRPSSWLTSSCILARIYIPTRSIGAGVDKHCVTMGWSCDAAQCLRKTLPQKSSLLPRKTFVAFSALWISHENGIWFGRKRLAAHHPPTTAVCGQTGSRL